ncbi:DUF4326 domain-containing protein [Pseudonocardia sp. H11422]|uniref:DUF4326 domain-containing protein n=1 Tax=Pseudonocardia sp. H11422 TaxID=2835866 RepID=UPI0027E31D71|nr:DUF4326 domain-containing protein [Pseudonocardia sp. H11422]
MGTRRDTARGDAATYRGAVPSAAPRRPRRIQLRRTKGWRKPVGVIVVARPGRWGNPFPVAELGRAEAVAAHRRWLLARPELLAAARRELAGHDLACWCPPSEACHADTLIELANGI